jgi:hypothetical protein
MILWRTSSSQKQKYFPFPLWGHTVDVIEAQRRFGLEQSGDGCVVAFGGVGWSYVERASPVFRQVTILRLGRS